ncbi:MAG: alpha-ketoglutarate-dependent dioxygenase AlkB [Caulobacteraceae bacterium]|nr:MAG: alpha-ketoglutarate-dependent dioxygenase AlkB [Caulobacteraceae bacterium]
MTDTLSLFPDLDPLPGPVEPAGLTYAQGVVSPDAQSDLMTRAATLAFAPFDFRGFSGNRRTVSFGSRYDFTHNRIDAAADFPDWLTALRAAAAGFAGLPEADLVQALVTEYAPGAGIGWHRDRPEYGRVIGLSFGSDCVLRFRRPQPTGWRRASTLLQPGSAYLLEGPARALWQHSIAPGDQLRYSVTFRTLRPPSGPGA